MQNALTSPGRKIAIQGVFVQIFVSFLLTIVVALVQVDLVVDVLLGCLSFIVPHSIFAYWVFRYAGASKNNLVAQSFNQGMKLKLILTVIFFVIAFSQFHAHPVALLGAYVITMVSQWLAMFWIK